MSCVGKMAGCILSHNRVMFPLSDSILWEFLSIVLSGLAALSGPLLRIGGVGLVAGDMKGTNIDTECGDREHRDLLSCIS